MVLRRERGVYILRITHETDLRNTNSNVASANLGREVSIYKGGYKVERRSVSCFKTLSAIKC